MRMETIIDLDREIEIKCYCFTNLVSCFMSLQAILSNYVAQIVIKEVLAPIVDDLILLGSSIQSFRHPEHQIPSIIDSVPITEGLEKI